uniref:Uncharacterized protein n=1 Tax=Arundo donax TaxID=35708 RepID=A0A0A9EGC6_ARUDO
MFNDSPSASLFGLKFAHNAESCATSPQTVLDLKYLKGSSVTRKLHLV